MQRANRARLNPVFSMAVILMCAAIGCDSNPSSPSADFGQSGSAGATLTGTFQRAASGFRASRVANEDNLTVVVSDASGEVARVKVAGGRFTLRGLPEEFTLTFMEGSTLVGEREFDAVKPNQELELLLSYDGTSVSVLEVKRTGIDHQPGDGIEIEGSITAITLNETRGDWTGSLEVDGYLIGTRAAQTSIREGNRSRNLDDLRDGNQVHVRGVFELVDGILWVFAHEIKLQEDEVDDDPSSEKVTICHMPPGNPNNKKTLTVGADAVAAHLGHGDSLGPCP